MIVDQLLDKYAFNIVFTKLSWGWFQSYWVFVNYVLLLIVFSVISVPLLNLIDYIVTKYLF